MYIRIHTHTHTYTYTYIHIRIHTHTHTYTYTCRYVLPGLLLPVACTQVSTTDRNAALALTQQATREGHEAGMEKITFTGVLIMA